MTKNIKDLNLFIQAAMTFGINYILIDKGMITDETIAELKQHGYSVMVGQGATVAELKQRGYLVGQGGAACIKISW